MKPLFHVFALSALLGSTASAFALTVFDPTLLPGLGAPHSDDALLLLIDSDDDDDEGEDDDDDDDDCEDDDEDEGDDDDDGCGKGAKNPAKSGTVTPPKNGIFGDGKAPKVVTN